MPNSGCFSTISPILLSIITIAVTWVGSIILFSIQNKKSVQNKWLDTFRDQMADLIVTANNITPHSTKEEFAAFSKAFFTIQFLLEPNNELHQDLKIAMHEFQKYALTINNRNFSSNTYTQKCDAVVSVFQKIMKQEKNKMQKIL